MTDPILKDAFAHHVWANEQVLEACSRLTEQQIQTPVPGTYGPIIDTLRHLVQADSFYLRVITGGRISEIDSQAKLSIAELRAANDNYKPEWISLLARANDPDEDVVEHGEARDVHATMGIRLAQILHHGTDHRSQVCTGLTSLGITPPGIDVWDYGATAGRAHEAKHVAS